MIAIIFSVIQAVITIALSAALVYVVRKCRAAYHAADAATAATRTTKQELDIARAVIGLLEQSVDEEERQRLDAESRLDEMRKMAWKMTIDRSHTSTVRPSEKCFSESIGFNAQFVAPGYSVGAVVSVPIDENLYPVFGEIVPVDDMKITFNSTDEDAIQ